MKRLVVIGGKQLEGEVHLSGAKNAALPMIAAACMGEEMTTLHNVPLGLQDVQIMIALLRSVGALIEMYPNTNTVRCCRGNFNENDTPIELASKIRYSLLLLGMAAGLQKFLFLPMPGGCQIGERKYDLHLMGLRKLGALVEESSEGIAIDSKGLTGTTIDFYLPTTSGTENIMLAAIFAKGTTLIRNANTRPEVVQMGELLAAMGAKITVRNRIVQIEGVSTLRGGATMTIQAGWDEAITYIVAAGATRSEIAIMNFDLKQIREDARYLRETGVDLFEWQGNVYVSARNRELKPFELFTAPYPGVNSDMQPIFAALALTIPGTSVVTDLRFTDRFDYVEELKKLGADIEAFGNSAVIEGGKPLHGAPVWATDLRGGAASIIAGLVSEGKTTIGNAYQIERGYENLVEKFNLLGASVTYEEEFVEPVIASIM